MHSLPLELFLRIWISFSGFLMPSPVLSHLVLELWFSRRAWNLFDESERVNYMLLMLFWHTPGKMSSTVLINGNRKFGPRSRFESGYLNLVIAKIFIAAFSCSLTRYYTKQHLSTPLVDTSLLHFLFPLFLSLLHLIMWKMFYFSGYLSSCNF